MPTTSARERGLSSLALLLLIPAPSLGVLFWMWLRPGDVTVWAASKVWLFGLPAAWLLWVDRGRPSWSPMRQGGALVGAATGVAIMIAIVAAYLLLGRHWIDLDATRASLASSGLDRLPIYLAGCAYWIFINSVLEEYVWRWFVYRKFETLMPKVAAVVAAAAAFTLHHTLALGFNFAWEWRVVAAGSLGVFIGGALWSWLYARYRSIWPGWISHAFADVGVFAVGYLILFT